MDDTAKPSDKSPRTLVTLRNPQTGEEFLYEMNDKGWLTRVSKTAPPENRVATSTKDEIEI